TGRRWGRSRRTGDSWSGWGATPPRTTPGAPTPRWGPMRARGASTTGRGADEVVRIALTRPMDEIRAELTRYPVATRLSLTGPMVVARDIAHAKIAERLGAGEPAHAAPP